MGQKIHPHGLRIGIHRKWNGSWFASNTEWKGLFYHQQQVEKFFKAVFHLYPYTKISTTKKVLLADLKLFKYGMKKLFIFIFFYKFRTKRRKQLTLRKFRAKFIKNKTWFNSKKKINEINYKK
jgi:hypothetical protein